jgi:hypothetical protein
MIGAPALISLWLLVVGVACAAAPPEDSTTVTLGAEHSLRGLAQAYLHDPDAWPEILRANNLESAHQLHPGMRLRIPVRALRDLGRDMTHLRELIYRATATGAQVFATEAIADAMIKQAAASEAQRTGDLKQAVELARDGVAAAERALAISQGNRDVAVQAVLDGADGTVQRRRPAEFDWTSIPVKTLLAELERLRTLSRSFALVRFRDASSLRLNENAQLAIRRIRRDQLTSHEQVDVVLYSGDVRALIESGGGREAVRIEVPGVATGVRSNHYWLQKTDDATRLANYDGEIEISAGGDTVVVRENQGTLVGANRPPKPPVDLLVAPALTGPVEGQTLYGDAVSFRWQPVDTAAAYWLEVARDRQFVKLVLTMTRIDRTQYDLPIAEEGTYFWRVSSVDASGLPGPASDGRGFQVARDTTPPYLVVDRPENDSVSTDPRVQLQGQTEAEAALTLNGRPVSLSEDGHFSLTETLAEGANRIELAARDPAGNLTQTQRTLHYHPGATLPLRFAEDLPRDVRARLLVNRSRFTLAGTSLPGAQIRVRSQDAVGVDASDRADAQGRFSITLPARNAATAFVLDATGPLGQQASQSFEVVLDGSPPRILLDTQPPQRTADPVLTLAGRLEEGVALDQGGQSIELAPDGRFTLKVQLRSGANVILLKARDLARNEADWQRTLVLDQEPPKLDAHRVIEQPGESARRVIVEIEAHDDSGMTAGIPFRLAVGDEMREGIAGRCPDRRCYRAQIVLPATSRGLPRLRSLTLQDYLGNRQEIELD